MITPGSSTIHPVGKRNSIISIRAVGLWFVEEKDEPDILRIGQKEVIADHAHAKALLVSRQQSSHEVDHEMKTGFSISLI